MMKKLFALICAVAWVAFLQARDLTQYVNPLMGTLSSFELSAGNTYPAIARPNMSTPPTRFGDSSRLTNPARGSTITGSGR